MMTREKPKQFYIQVNMIGGTALWEGMALPLPAYTNPDGTGGLAQKYWNKVVYGHDPAMRNYTGYVNNNGDAGWINHRNYSRYADVILMLAEAANEVGRWCYGC